MAVKTAELRHEGGMRFVARTGSGFEITMDNEAGGSGPRPIEMLAVAIGGCTGMDVASILDKKRQRVSRYAIRVEAVQRNAHPHAFQHIVITHEVEGPAVDVEAVARAIELSATRYCSVSTGLAAGIAELHHRYVVISPEGVAPVEGEAIVTGPGQELPPDET
jgi:putative redox protein